jgi:hypothetical protein
LEICRITETANKANIIRLEVCAVGVRFTRIKNPIASNEKFSSLKVREDDHKDKKNKNSKSSSNQHSLPTSENRFERKEGGIVNNGR